jgi:hypothetical protein
MRPYVPPKTKLILSKIHPPKEGNVSTTHPTKGESMNTTLETITINGIEYVQKSAVPPSYAQTGDEVIVRTYSAGVHIGNLKSRDGREVVLTNARRLYSWQGAFTLNAVATLGVSRSGSRISKPVSEITLLEAIEIIPVASNVDLSTTEE